MRTVNGVRIKKKGRKEKKDNGINGITTIVM